MDWTKSAATEYRRELSKQLTFSVLAVVWGSDRCSHPPLSLLMG